MAEQVGFFEDKEVFNVFFMNEAHDTVEVHWSDPNEKEKKLRLYQLDFTDLDHPDVRSIIAKGFTAEKIQKDTIEENQAQAKAFKDTLRFMAGVEMEEMEAKYKERIADLERTQGMDAAQIVPLVVNNTDDDVLFKAKLAAFELDKVEKSRSKTLKSDIRQAESLIKLFGILAKLYK